MSETNSTRLTWLSVRKWSLIWVFHHVISEKSQLKLFIHRELQCAYFFKICFCLYFLNSVCGCNFFIDTVYCVFCESSRCEK